MTVSIFTEANQFLRTGQLDKAVIAYRQAIDQNPLFYWHHQNLGEALAKVGRVEEAIAAFHQAIALNSKSPWSLYQLGELLRRQEQFEEAVFFLRQAVEIKSDVPEFYLSLREALVKLGQSSEAAEVYQRAKELNPRLLDLQEDWQKLQGNHLGLSSVPGAERNLTVTAIQDCILQYASLQKNLKLDQPKKKSTVFRAGFDSQENKNDTSQQIHGDHPTSVSEQSGLKAGLIQEDEKYILALRLSGIVENIQKNSKPKVIEKLETLHHSYDNPGFIDWEKVLELGYRLFLSANSTVIDIGGHAGRHSDIFINKIGCKQVYIFEPIPSKYQHLVNRYLSNLNVTVKQVALSSSVGKSEFIINHGAPEESGLKERIYNNPELKNLEKIVVPTDTLDNIFIDASAVEYIKIDTEGGEIDILKGAVSLLHKFRPFISVEYGKPSYSAYGHNEDTLFVYCQKQAYVITDLFGNPIESIDIWRECVDSFYWDYYLVPQEKLSLFRSLLTGFEEKEAVRNHTKIELNGEDKPCNPEPMPEEKDNDPPNSPFDYHKYPRYLNLGCGYDIRPGYLNVDFQEKHNPDLIADIRLLDMLPSGYYEEIVAQDCLEHFPRTDTELALKEWHRLLKTGGILKLRVPDIASAFAILNSSTDINHQKGWIQMIFGSQAYTGDFHFTSFTEVLVRHYLEDAGFKINELQLHDRWLFDIVAEKIN